MADEIMCACCHRKIDLESLPVCGFCGHLNMAMVGGSDYIDETALQHRRELLEKLKDIAVVGYEYGWNEQTKKYEQLSTKKYKIANGLECDGKVVWSTQDFGQWWNESEEKVQIKVGFQFGKSWSVKCNFLPQDCPSFWHVGVEVTEDMRLVVYFGTKEKFAKSSAIEFVPLLSQ